MGKKQQDKPASSQRGTSHLILIQHSTGANTSPEACTYVPAHPLDVLTKRGFLGASGLNSNIVQISAFLPQKFFSISRAVCTALNIRSSGLLLGDRRKVHMSILSAKDAPRSCPTVSW